MRRFAGIDLINVRMPNERTIQSFLYLLDKHGLGEQIFETGKAHLKASNTTMGLVDIVDSNFIAAPSR